MSDDPGVQNYDFDRLSDLYKADPVAFEKERLALIAATISKVDGNERQLRMKQHQFRIDSSLRKYKDPIVRLAKITPMFYESLGLLNAALQKYFPPKLKGEAPAKTAEVIQLKTK